MSVYAVVPPQAARNPEFYQRQNIPVPTLRVVREDDDGVVISGMKMLATGALYANEIWIGNVIPLAPDQKKQAITCAIACNAPGLTLWSRKPAMVGATSEFDSPLAWRYDESDSMLLCDNVKVPWENVFVHDDALLSRDIYINTPSHCFGNHQSNVRYWSKMRLLLGLCSKIANATGADQVPAVRETLGKMARWRAPSPAWCTARSTPIEEWPPGLCLLQSPDHVCGARLVHAELQQIHRRAARALRRWRFSNAGRRLGHGQSRAREGVLDLLADAAGRCAHAHEAVQACLGHGRLGIRRPASAIREILRRRARSSFATTPIARPIGASSTAWSRISWRATTISRRMSEDRRRTRHCPCSAVNPPADLFCACGPWVPDEQARPQPGERRSGTQQGKQCEADRCIARH